MSVVVRPARPDEVERAGELVHDTYVGDGLVAASSPYTRVLRDAASRAATAVLIVAVDEAGSMLGTVTYAPNGTPYAQVARDGEAEFRMLAVATTARRRGIARALVLDVVERARADGATGLVLSSSADMTAAHRLYAELGFLRTPERDWEPPGDAISLRVFVLPLA